MFGSLWLIFSKAPQEASRHVVVTLSSSSKTQEDAPPVQLTRPPRHSYPKEMLTHSFQPFGSQVKTTSRDPSIQDVSMDVDSPQLPPPSTQTPKKKRKGVDDATSEHTKSTKKRKKDKDLTAAA